jgi:hypothetical protein
VDTVNFAGLWNSQAFGTRKPVEFTSLWQALNFGQGQSEVKAAVWEDKVATCAIRRELGKGPDQVSPGG